MTGQPVDEQRDGRPVGELIDDHERSYAVFAVFARQVRDEQRLDDAFVDHFGGHMTFGGAILHVVLHDAEHRAEALHILQRLGAPDLPEVDHGFWGLTVRGA